MANKKLTLNPGRQYPLVVMQAFTFENVSESGVAVPLAKLPRGAVVVGGTVNVSTGFGAGATLKLGYAGDDDAYGTIDVSAAAVKPVTLTGTSSDKVELIATPGGAYAAGAATLCLTYVIVDRANEAQP